jgi:hypothetical protein
MAGGKVDFVKAPPYGDDGHGLFSAAGIPLWTPMVDDFLRAQNLVLRSQLLPPPTSPDIRPPPQLSGSGHAAFAQFLPAAPHKAFAVSPAGAYGWVSAARAAALANCPERDCRIAIVNDTAMR